MNSFVTLILAAILFMTIRRRSQKIPPISSKRRILIAGYFGHIIFVVIYSIAVLVFGKGDFKGFGLSFDGFIPSLPISLTWGCCIGLLLCLHLFSVVRQHEPFLLVKPKKDKLEAVLACSYFFIMIPMGEEFLFRGFVQSYMMTIFHQEIILIIWPFKIGTLIAAFIFWAFHLLNAVDKSRGWVIKTMVSALIPALGLSYVYQDSGCILNTIIAHGLSGGPYVLLSYVFVYLNLRPERKEEESIL